MLFPLFLYEFPIGHLTVAVKQLVDIQARIKGMCVHGNEVALFVKRTVEPNAALHVEDLKPCILAICFAYRDVEDAVGWVGIGRMLCHHAVFLYHIPGDVDVRAAELHKLIPLERLILIVDAVPRADKGEASTVVEGRRRSPHTEHHVVFPYDLAPQKVEVLVDQRDVEMLHVLVINGEAAKGEGEDGGVVDVGRRGALGRERAGVVRWQPQLGEDVERRIQLVELVVVEGGA